MPQLSDQALKAAACSAVLKQQIHRALEPLDQWAGHGLRALWLQCRSRHSPRVGKLHSIRVLAPMVSDDLPVAADSYVLFGHALKYRTAVRTGLRLILRSPFQIHRILGPR